MMADARTAQRSDAVVVGLTRPDRVAAAVHAAWLVALLSQRDRRPSWRLLVESPGHNLLGVPVSQCALVMGWDGRAEGTATRLSALTAPLRLLPGEAVWLADQLQVRHEDALRAAPYVPLMREAATDLIPSIALRNLLGGMRIPQVADALRQFERQPKLLDEVHQAAAFEAADPDSWPDRAVVDEGAPVGDCCGIEVDRTAADVVVAFRIPIGSPQLPGILRGLRAATMELRRRLFRRGGVYGVDVQVSLVEGTVMFTTNVDSCPGSTVETVLALLDDAVVSRAVACPPDAALGFLPVDLPRVDDAARAVVDRAMGLTPNVAHRLVQPSPPVEGPLLRHLDQYRVVKIGGPRRLIDEVLEATS